AFDGDDFARQARQNGGLIAGACSDFEHAMVGADFKPFGHIGHDEGLTDRLSTFDRQGLIGISAFDEARSDKFLPRHFLHGAKHGLIADPAPAQRKLEFHALDVVSGWLYGHGRLASTLLPPLFWPPP